MKKRSVFFLNFLAEKTEKKTENCATSFYFSKTKKKLWINWTNCAWWCMTKTCLILLLFHFILFFSICFVLDLSVVRCKNKWRNQKFLLKEKKTLVFEKGKIDCYPGKKCVKFENRGFFWRKLSEFFGLKVVLWI